MWSLGCGEGPASGMEKQTREQSQALLFHGDLLWSPGAATRPWGLIRSCSLGMLSEIKTVSL